MPINDNLKAALEALPDEGVTEDYITSRIATTEYIRVANDVMACRLVLDNGFSVIGVSACVDPANFNRDLSAMSAHDDAFRKLGPLFGFLMAEKRLYEGVDEARRVPLYRKRRKRVAPSQIQAQHFSRL